MVSIVQYIFLLVTAFVLRHFKCNRLHKTTTVQQKNRLVCIVSSSFKVFNVYLEITVHVCGRLMFWVASYCLSGLECDISVTQFTHCTRLRGITNQFSFVYTISKWLCCCHLLSVANHKWTNIKLWSIVVGEL